ncbi:MAG: hypothetical protein ABSH21_12190 [Verrucomicrobiia bacterium]|jgi:hypothetical protein
MRKLFAVAAVAALMGVVSGWAQTTNILEKQDITINGKLSPSGTAVTDASLSGNANAISRLDLQIISGDGTTTNEEQWIGQVVGSTFNLLLQLKERVDLTPDSTKGDKFVVVFVGKGQVGTASNAVILVSGSSMQKVVKGATNNTVIAKFQGVWVDGTDSDAGEAVAGSLASVKVK